MATQSNYRFAFGPWNIHEGADPFGPTVRPTVVFAKKLSAYKELGFDGIEFHDDDAVPDVDKKNPSQIDLPQGAVSGLVEATALLRGVEGIAQIRFTAADVVRHPLVARIVQAYDRASETGAER